MNTKLRCRGCKDYFPREEISYGFCSLECRTRKTPKVKKKPKQTSEFEAVRPSIVARAQGKCEARVPAVCTGEGEHVHHRQLRSQNSDGNYPSNLILLCHPCHTWAHAEVEAAKSVGLIVSSWDDPAKIPVTASRYRKSEVQSTAQESS